MESSLHFHPCVLFSSWSCTPQQGSLLHLTSYKIHPPPLFWFMPALNRKLFSADINVNLAPNGGKSAFLWWLHLKSHPAPSCPHFIFFYLSSCSVSLYFTAFSFFLSHPDHLSFGPLWCHGMRHHSSGATLCCCIVVLLSSVTETMPPSPTV